MIIFSDKSKERLDTCKKCDKFILDRNRCSVCGCYMPAKTKLKGSKCPLGRWEGL